MHAMRYNNTALCLLLLLLVVQEAHAQDRLDFGGDVLPVPVVQTVNGNTAQTVDGLIVRAARTPEPERMAARSQDLGACKLPAALPCLASAATDQSPMIRARRWHKHSLTSRIPRAPRPCTHW